MMPQLTTTRGATVASPLNLPFAAIAYSYFSLTLIFLALIFLVAARAPLLASLRAACARSMLWDPAYIRG
jgi:hypothetical protein